ncbi:MAG: 5-(carboxyamino)imidazole ribonucleotide mutase [Acidobacteria bacterium]|nr:5-(carboxyamino)imidazole ribonucleotide mutase [Acidobacteriota bacterium]
MTSGRPVVAVLMGSDSDLPVMAEVVRVLEDYGIAHEVRVLSAHRSPDAAAEFARAAEGAGFRIIVAGAGGAAHLAGVMAAHTTLPVIGVPLASSPLSGFDSLLSTVQMPPGIPVATMGVGAMGAKNAGHLAAAILALGDAELRQRLRDRRTAMAEGVVKASAGLAARLAELLKKP